MGPAAAINTWFGNPGSSELTLMEEFPTDFRYLLGLQEMVPVGMADGFSQVTGRPALVMLHTAPGLGNGMGALYNAYLNKTPLIVIAGNQRRTMQNQKTLLTNEDATMVPRPFVKWTAEPAIASEVPRSSPVPSTSRCPRPPDRSSSRCRWTTRPTSSATRRSRRSR
ncbi:thiamine pyrophosphate-binding protein [Streptomyces sp. NPDC007251]|uniref:thiamine pyrophosphate-binding protein n=1 Tax=Streptomyces sp. NPDC007251 TaxID=3154483 RepID=UPI0033C2566A